MRLLGFRGRLEDAGYEPILEASFSNPYYLVNGKIPSTCV